MRRVSCTRVLRRAHVAAWLVGDDLAERLPTDKLIVYTRARALLDSVAELGSVRPNLTHRRRIEPVIETVEEMDFSSSRASRRPRQNTGGHERHRVQPVAAGQSRLPAQRPGQRWMRDLTSNETEQPDM